MPLKYSAPLQAFGFKKKFPAKKIPSFALHLTFCLQCLLMIAFVICDGTFFPAYDRSFHWVCFKFSSTFGLVDMACLCISKEAIGACVRRRAGMCVRVRMCVCYGVCRERFVWEMVWECIKGSMC